MSNLTVCTVGSSLKEENMLILRLKILVAKLSSSLPAVLVIIFYVPRHKMGDTSG